MTIRNYKPYKNTRIKNKSIKKDEKQTYTTQITTKQINIKRKKKKKHKWLNEKQTRFREITEEQNI